MRKFNFLRALLKQDPGAKGDKLFRLDNLTDRWPLWKLLRVKRSLFLKPDPPGTWWFFDLRIQPSTLFSNEEKAELKLSRFAVCWSCQCSSTSKSFSFSSSKWEMFFCSFYYLIYTEYLCAQWNVCHRNISAKNTSQWNPLIKKKKTVLKLFKFIQISSHLLCTFVTFCFLLTYCNYNSAQV